MTKIKKGSLTVTNEPGVEHGVDIRWAFSSPLKTDHFEVECEYSAKYDSKKKKWVWISGGVMSPSVADAAVNQKQTNYRVSWTAPGNAYVARVRVKPVAKTKEGKKDPYYKGAFCKYSSNVDFRTDPLPIPSISANIDANTRKATVTVNANDSDARYCQIEAIYGFGDAKTYPVNETGIKLANGSATKIYDVSSGQTWRFFARTMSGGSKATSSWSTAAYVTAKPAKPTFPKKGYSSSYGENGIKVVWNAVTGAESYTAEYVADNPAYFKNNRDAVRSVPNIETAQFVQTNLELGHTWYVRVKAVNSGGDGPWSDNVSAKLKLNPDVPTTYDTDPAYMRGDSVRMRWTHNCEDNSEQYAAQVYMRVIGAQSGAYYDVSPGTDSFYVKPLSGFEDGDVVKWCVKTQSQYSEWSPWSVYRQFEVYDMPNVTCTLTQLVDGNPVAVDDDENPLGSLPLTVTVNATGGGNVVAGYHLMFVAESNVVRPSFDGTETVVAAGNVVYELDYPTSESPCDIPIGVEAGLPDSSELSVTAEAIMASGLRGYDTKAFDTDFGGEVPIPIATVYFDPDELTATIECACHELDEDGAETDTLAQDVVLSVYRICSDNSLVLIASGIENSGNAVVVDPHAAFGICEYRVVAMDTTTGAISYDDGGADSTHTTCAVQWDERWDGLTDTSDPEGEPVYTYAGSRIDGLYNLSLDESGSMQAEDAEYIGRKHPVSYYGTQRGHRASYAVEFPKTDTETLAKCRRLIAYPGDVYVREPSGLGFWARIDAPSIGRGYDSQAVRFSFTAVHVEHSEQAVGMPVEEVEE